MHIIKYQIYHKICIGHSEIFKSSGLPPCKTAFTHPSVLKYLLCSHYVAVLSYTLGMDSFLIKFISFTFQLQFPLSLLLPSPHCNRPLPPSKQSFSVPVQKEPGQAYYQYPQNWSYQAAVNISSFPCIKAGQRNPV